MRFISVVAAVGTAIGATFDFGLAHSADMGAEPVNWVAITAPEAGFSASFPAQPQVERTTHNQSGEIYKSTRYTAVATDMAMAVEYSVYNDPATRIDLQKVMTGFAGAMNGKIMAKWDTTYQRSFGGALPMLEYTVQNGDTICRAGAIADGPAVYQVIGCANKAAAMPIDIERMLSSFTLMPRAA
jgi:hypothetical protein